MKNRISSIGKPRILKSSVYCGLNDQWPLYVATASHAMNMAATMAMAGRSSFSLE